jgi:hypothetical protein
MSRILRHLLIPVLLLLPAASALGQEGPPTPPGEGPEGQELRQAIRQHFSNRLRAELGLTDEQTEALRPLIDEIERSRAQSRREKAATSRSLQRGLQEGASDSELQELLERLDTIEDEQRAFERSVQARIDQHLTVRQRVQFRFFAERFRRGLERRIDEFRRQRRGRTGPGPQGGPGPVPR